MSFRVRITLAFVPIELLLDIDLSVSSSCKSREGNLELQVTEGAHANSRSAAQPLHDAQSTFPHAT